MMACLRLSKWMMLCLGLLYAVGSAAAAGLSAWPCVGRPAITVPGGEFGVGDVETGTAFLLQDGARVALPVLPDDTDLYGGLGRVTIPPTLAPGRYDLAVSASGGESVRAGAVYVLGDEKKNYAMALVKSDVPGKNDAGTLFSSALLDRIGAASVDLVFVVGRLTRDGQRASYDALKHQFSALSMPVIFCPDQGELLRGSYRGVFGDPVYPFRFGKDGFLILGAGMGRAGSGTEARMGPIYRWRRALRACRWSTGVAGRLGLDWTMRSQLILFVDDPLDYLIAGEIPDGFGDKIPWGRTRLAVGSSVAGESFQVIDVNEAGMLLRK